jgi:hypothetical protein
MNPQTVPGFQGNLPDEDLSDEDMGGQEDLSSEEGGQ